MDPDLTRPAVPHHRPVGGTPPLGRDAPAHGLDAILVDAMAAVRGDFALTALRIDSERLAIQAAAGPIAEDMVGNVMPLAESVAAPVFRTGSTMLVTDYPVRGAAAPEIRQSIGSVVVVPVVVDGRTVAAVSVGRRTGRADYACLDETDVDAVAAVVARSRIVHELTAVREERRTAHLLADRDRMHADLHDHVIQELFATMMSLESLARSVTDPVLRNRLLVQVDGLDLAVQRLRLLVREEPRNAFAPNTMPLPKRLIGIVDSLTPALRCRPTVSFVGPIDTLSHLPVADDLEATLREALTNIARHAAATIVRVTVRHRGNEVMMDIIDNGRGLPAGVALRGLATLRQRAERHGGQLEMLAPRAGGTKLTWTARLVG